MYNIIDDARQKALKKIEHRSSHPKPTQSKSSSSSSARYPTPTNTGGAGGGGVSGGGGAEGDASSRASLRAAIEAIDGLTKLDVAEIRTMVSTPSTSPSDTSLHSLPLLHIPTLPPLIHVPTLPLLTFTASIYNKIGNNPLVFISPFLTFTLPPPPSHYYLSHQVNPPAAVEVVLEAVMVLLTGKMMTFQDTRRLLNGGEAFLLMLQQFRVEDVTVSTCSRHMLSIHDIAHLLRSIFKQPPSYLPSVPPSHISSFHPHPFPFIIPPLTPHPIICILPP